MNFMHDGLWEYLDQFVLVFLDGILVYSLMVKEHAEHLRQIFSKLREWQLYAKASKCQMMNSSIEFLG